MSRLHFSVIHYRKESKITERTEGTAARSAASGEPSSLRGNAISVVGATVMCLVVLGPVISAAFVVPLIAAKAGAAVPFVCILATVGVLCIAYTIGQFTYWVPRAGSFYEFNSRGLGPSAGFSSGWLLLFAYALAFPLNMLVFGYFLSTVLQSQLGIAVPWWTIMIGGTIIIAGLAILGLSLSIRVDIALVIAEIVALLVLAIVIIAKGGADGNTAAVLTPAAPGARSGGLLFGLVYAFLIFAGFEVAATVSEETRHARRNISRALIASVLAAGAFYVFMTYAITVGYGAGHISRLLNDAAPLDTLAAHYVGYGFPTIINLAVISPCSPPPAAYATAWPGSCSPWGAIVCYPGRCRGYIPGMRLPMLPSLPGACSASPSRSDSGYPWDRIRGRLATSLRSSRSPCSCYTRRSAFR
jgi:amino acid transporter